MTFILGLVFLFLGFFLIKKTEWFLENAGRIAFFEDKLASSGGSRLGYKIIGVGISIAGILMVTGLGDNFLLWIFSPFLRVYE